MELKFGDIKGAKYNIAVTAVFEDCQFPKLTKEMDGKSGGKISKACALRKFKGKKGEFLLFLFPDNLGLDALILAGFGKPGEITAKTAQSVGGALIPYINRHRLAGAAVLLDDAWEGVKLPIHEIAANMAFGARLKDYRFDKYRTKQKEDEKPTLQTLDILLPDPAKAENIYGDMDKIVQAVYHTRDLVSEPANIINPETLAASCKHLSSLGIEVEVLGEDKLCTLGMNALLGVGQGSRMESHVVSLVWRGDKNSQETPLALVGKGITFDSGGISIKPSGGMEEMKWDMAGAATVIGVIKALALRKAKVNVVGVVALAENMPSSTAQRPGDVVKSMSGQTIEVINTDAEGRLILADALWYTQEKFKPASVIDLATLTGAVIVALGSFKAGAFANSEELLNKLITSGKEVGEPLWELPLGEEYDKQINSDIADMKNVGESREAGSTSGAIFLQRFIKEGVTWAHLDIAGVAWGKKDTDTCPKGATAFGLRLLERYIRDNLEK